MLFFAFTDILVPQGHTPDVPVPPNPDPDREIRFFENPDFSIFRLFKLKDPTTWVSIDSPESHSPFGQSLRPYLIYNCYSVNVI